MNHHSRVNPFEIALWILAVALLAVGGAGALWASRVMNGGYTCTGDNCSPPVDYALAQTFYMMSPPLVTAGLVAAVLSIALRAGLSGIARRTAEMGSSAAEPEDASTVGAAAGQQSAPESTATSANDGPTVRAAPVSFAPPQFRSRQRATDHSAFQRPGAE